MAGSQLKQLKAALKDKGLIGQTNIKKKNKKSKTPSETRRNDQEQIINDIRSNFNKFDQRINRTKRDVTVIKGGKFVKVGSQQHNDATRTHTSIQKSMKMQYDLEKQKHGKTGGLQDRRFGENNKHMTAEEKMLERFTRERQTQSKKKNVFSIGSDDEELEEDDGFILTHAGKNLAMDLEDDEGELGQSNVRYVDEDQQVEEEPPRRKTKKDVMKEVMAKSKFYKHQRQQEQLERQETIMDLDDEFGDIMQEFNTMAPAKAMKKKSEDDIDYDSKVRELTYDKRSVPADRTKTQEEIQKEHTDKLKKLEADRLKRMEGLDVDERNAEGDDLDGEFWAGSDEDEAEGFTIKESDNENESDSELEDEDKPASSKPKSIRIPAITMPASHQQFLEQIEDIKPKNQPEYIKKIIAHYKPNLAMGNKDKMNVFIGILFEYVLYLSQESGNQDLIENIMVIMKQLADSFNEELVENIRKEIDIIQGRIIEKRLLKRDCIFFILIGYLFSTSDQYHLIVTPTLILMNEILANFHYEGESSKLDLYQGVLIVDILLNYQRISQRYYPEVINFLQKALILIVPEPNQIDKSYKASSATINKATKFDAIENSNIEIGQLFDSSNLDNNLLKFQILNKIIGLIDKIASMYKDKSALIEIINPFITILKHLIKYYAIQLPQIGKTLTKLINLTTIATKERVPLTLQTHRQISIATYVPKFEENFNPDKKSYDVNVERQELNKVKAQFKKERKQALKDIRQETKFVAREQINEKKKMYSDYHKKMSSIVNSISTIEGAEKNEYEREKKQRKK